MTRGPVAPTPVIIDTDPGLGVPGADIDDGIAIALALASVELDVKALTVVNGNVDVDTGVSNAVRLLQRLGRSDVPVFRGAGSPLLRDMGPVREIFARFLSGPDAQGTAREMLSATSTTPAARYLVEAAAAAPKEITVIAIGPMTNLAIALALDPSFAQNVAELLLMAGSATTYAQNMTVVGDFNAYVDPEALAIVLASGAPIRMVGLDQTSQVMLTRGDAEALGQTADDFNGWLAECTYAWISFLARSFPNRPEHREACFLHDPLVVATVSEPSLCSWADAHVQVETKSELTRGLVVADRALALVPPAGTPNASVAVRTNVNAFHDHLMSRLLKLPLH